MPILLPLLAVLLLVPLFVVVILLLIPVGVVQRYRLGRKRQKARGWLSLLNVWGYAFSAVLLLLSATVTALWEPRALLWTVLGLLAGALLGLLGLALTRWEDTGGRLFLTPNRWLVLLLTLTVSARILYGFWRAARAVGRALGDGVEASLLSEAGLPGSLAAAGLFLGYHVAFWLGVRRRIRA